MGGAQKAIKPKSVIMGIFFIIFSSWHGAFSGFCCEKAL
jgi:hypothetical protein